MTEQGTRVVVVAPTFLSVFHTTISGQLRKVFKADEISLRTVTDDVNTQKVQLHRALVEGKPTALIAISVRPDSETVAATPRPILQSSAFARPSSPRSGNLWRRSRKPRTVWL